MTFIVLNLMIQMFLTGLMFFAIWVMICNQWAYKDTSSFLTAIRHRPFSGPALLHAFGKATYFQHVWARVFFRDPWRLYDPCVKDAVDNPKSEMPVLSQEGVRIEIDAKGYASYGEQGTKH